MGFYFISIVDVAIKFGFWRLGIRDWNLDLGCQQVEKKLHESVKIASYE